MRTQNYDLPNKDRLLCLLSFKISCLTRFFSFNTEKWYPHLAGQFKLMCLIDTWNDSAGSNGIPTQGPVVRKPINVIQN